MRSTSQLFGLHVNQWVDERKDPEKATVAAARYLKHLYGIFGDWPLALASYNAGEGTVMRAIKYQGTTNYWELRLPKQTEEYVPQFMAALAISRDPVKYGFADIELDDPMRFDEVALKGAVDLRAVAKLAECSYEELRDLNPSARTSMMRGPSGITMVRVPEGKSEVIQRNLAAGAQLPRVNLTVRHRVRRGETLRAIAAEYAVNPNELARVNNLGRGRPLRRGMMLTVPASMKAPPPEVLAADFENQDPSASTDYVPSRRIGLPGRIDGNSVPIDRITHTVKRGESLAGIAGKYGVTITELRQWNRLSTSYVKVGTRLRIRRDDASTEKAPVAVARPSTPPAATSADTKDVTPPKPTDVAKRSVADATVLDSPAGGKAKSKKGMVASSRTHTVRAGETILEIAGKHNVSVESLRKLNKLRTTRVVPGQVLKLPA
jgi:membrane-bound lytic murein transglycosylase D